MSTINREIFIEYRVSGVLTTAFNVVLKSQDGAWGIRRVDNGEVLIPAGAATGNPSIGLYTFNTDFEVGVIYQVSWQITATETSQPTYFVEDIGPFSSPEATIRAVADKRGTMIQGTLGNFFLKISDIDGNAVDPTSIYITLQDSTGAPVIDDSGNMLYLLNPEKIGEGFYAYDWNISPVLPLGTYTVTWNYTADGQDRVVIEEVNVTENTPQQTQLMLYVNWMNNFRRRLEHMIHEAQFIPVYREPAKKSRDLKTYNFTFKNWNQSSGVRVYRNDELVNDGVTVNYFNGTITFDSPQTPYDRIEVDYNFRWFSDEQIDRFLSNAVHLLNIWPPVNPTYSIFNLDPRFIPVVLYGAAVDALRSLMLSLQYQQPQLVFGGPERADKVFSNLEGLKKNYEETWNKALEQKKNGPYRGLTKMIVTPEFALPGGRARWFRMMFSGGS